MPRMNPVRSIDAETAVAARLTYERKRREMGVDAVAREMTKLGCPITGSAISRIEKGDPPRRITFDEAVAISRLFEVPLEELDTPLPLLEKRRARELIEETLESHREIGAFASRAFEHFVDLYDLAAEDEELFDYVLFQIEASGSQGEYTLSVEADDDGAEVARLALLRLVASHNEFRRSIMSAASMWSAYRSGRWTEESQQRATEMLATLERELSDVEVEVEP